MPLQAVKLPQYFLLRVAQLRYFRLERDLEEVATTLGVKMGVCQDAVPVMFLLLMSVINKLHLMLKRLIKIKGSSSSLKCTVNVCTDACVSGITKAGAVSLSKIGLTLEKAR